MKIGIGIDTGGTYTDAVIYDFEQKTILGSAKALTTKEDLSLGILGALDALPSDWLQKAQLISLSTTLATNACVEDKGGAAKLIFFGGNEEVINELGGKYGLPPAEDMYIQKSYTKFSGEVEREPDWELFKNNMELLANHYDGLAIVEMNAMKNGAVIETAAKSLVEEQSDVSVVCGHELFSELNCLQRASSTLLNARLFPVIKEFLTAIKSALIKRNIQATVVIVRSDGSLMSEEFAQIRPVETLLCGPAASVIGGQWLSNDANCIVVDMGGTTTDMALLKNNIPVTVTDGVSIGKWKTFVDGLYINTFGLGGDSAIHYNDKKLFLEEYRVVPLCVAAEKYPSIAENLRKLLKDGNKHTQYLHEHYMLVKDISHMTRYSEQEQIFCQALKDGPLPLRDAPAVIGKDMYNINVARLLKEGVVQICGLTPTDIMHINKDFEKYSSEVSLLGAQYVAMNLGISVEALCDFVYDEVKRKIYRHVVMVMLENKDSYYLKEGFNKDVIYLIDQSYELAKSQREEDLISMRFQTNFTLVGLGAPIKIFLEDVATMLGTKAVIADHFEVANALGAIVGNVCVSHTVEIQPIYKADGIAGYTVFGIAENKVFENLDEAENFALTQARQGAREEAINRGASGNITVSSRLDVDEVAARECIIHLGTKAVASAVGAISF